MPLVTSSQCTLDTSCTLRPRFCSDSKNLLLVQRHVLSLCINMLHALPWMTHNRRLMLAMFWLVHFSPIIINCWPSSKQPEHINQDINASTHCNCHNITILWLFLAYFRLSCFFFCTIFCHHCKIYSRSKVLKDYPGKEWGSKDLCNKGYLLSTFIG